MKVPKARKLKSGNWFIQLRLGGESIPITAASEKACVREAQAIKAEYLAGKRAPKEPEKESPQPLTLTQVIDDYIKSKDNVLSPSTIRGYRNIQKSQFKTLMNRDVYELLKLSDEEWQMIINTEAEKYSPKTIRSGFSFIKTVVQAKTKQMLPNVTMPAVIVHDTAFLTAEEIPKFVKAVYDTDIAVPALLALSSMRISEIQALDWKDIKEDPEFIRTSGAMVPDEHNKLQRRKQNKNQTSARYVPILIPELSQAIKRDRKPSGPVMPFSRSYFLDRVHQICKDNNLSDVTVHGLRHSFASLAYSLQIPEKVAMEIGGWADSGTMHKIYTHISKQDISRYKTAIADFYSGKNKSEESQEKTS